MIPNKKHTAFLNSISNQYRGYRKINRCLNEIHEKWTVSRKAEIQIYGGFLKEAIINFYCLVSQMNFLHVPGPFFRMREISFFFLIICSFTFSGEPLC